VRIDEKIPDSISIEQVKRGQKEEGGKSQPLNCGRLIGSI
jgi:hypothetical protein